MGRCQLCNVWWMNKRSWKSIWGRLKPYRKYLWTRPQRLGLTNKRHRWVSLLHRLLSWKIILMSWEDNYLHYRPYRQNNCRTSSKFTHIIKLSSSSPLTSCFHSSSYSSIFTKLEKSFTRNKNFQLVSKSNNFKIQHLQSKHSTLLKYTHCLKNSKCLMFS